MPTINLSAEMIATLKHACNTSLHDDNTTLTYAQNAVNGYESQLRDKGQLNKAATKNYERAKQNRALLTERIANVEEALAMLSELE